MTSGEVLQIISKMAGEYAPSCRESLKRNKHMHKEREDQIYELPQSWK